MGFFRSYIAPFFIVLIFAIAMLAVSARIFLPSDLAAPAPLDDQEAQVIDHAHPLLAQFRQTPPPPIG